MSLLNYFGRKEEKEDLPSFPMPPEHKHAWVLVGKTYARPRPDATAIASLPKEIQEKALFGVTSTTWECGGCGERRQETMLGSDINPIDEVLDKVEDFGSQLIERNGQRYVVTRWNPPTAQQGFVPLK